MPRPVNALIIDDESHVVVLLRAMLKQLGIETVWDAPDSAAGLELVRARNPDVVLLDLNLPHIDGLAILAKIKESHPKMPVIVVSAQNTMRTVSRARELGAVQFIVKHAAKVEVLQMLSDALDSIAETSGGARRKAGRTGLSGPGASRVAPWVQGPVRGAIACSSCCNRSSGRLLAGGSGGGFAIPGPAFSAGVSGF
jgi:DNA-binding NtrC family response regulator